MKFLSSNKKLSITSLKKTKTKTRDRIIPTGTPNQIRKSKNILCDCVTNVPVKAWNSSTAEKFANPTRLNP